MGRSNRAARPKSAPAASVAHGAKLTAFGVAAAAIVLLAAGLRVYAVQTANLWLDEFWTLELSCGRDTAHEHLPLNVLLDSTPGLTSTADARPWWTIPTSLSQVTHPPLFFLILRGWRTLLGPSDIAARLLPWLASVVAVVLLYRVVARINGRVAALWATLLMALSGQQIFYAQEVRSYSLIVAVGLGALTVLVEIERRGASAPRLVSFAGLALALVLTHYFTIGLVAALATYAAIHLRRREAIRVAVALAAAGILFAVIWGPFLLKQKGAMALESSGGAAFLLDRGTGHVARTLARLAAVPAQSLAPATFMSPASLPPLIAWAALPAFLIPLAWLRRQPDLLVWYLWVAGVVIPLVALDLARNSMHLAFPRYTLLAGPGVFAIVGAGFVGLKGAWRHAVPAAVAVACVVLLPASLRQASSKFDWQPIATLAAESMGPDDALVVTGPPDRAPLVFLYVSHYLRRLNRPVAVITQPLRPSLRDQLRSRPRTWAISVWPGQPTVFDRARFVPIAANEAADFGRVEWQP